ncbi:MAG TPA: hypothetical protein VJT75_11480 [Thermoleophilaceae bacterium]|nr:hypothetical protein [Thermoleophilaceae bacterium]
MNAVSLIGTLTDDPELQEGRCTLRLAVPRRSRDGRRFPGVVYVTVESAGAEAQECAALVQGARMGLAGRLDDAGNVLLDQLDAL